MSTEIQWADETVNPLRARHRVTWASGWACVKVATGCQHCYAETMNEAKRFNLGTGLPYDVKSIEQVEHVLDETVLQKVLRWRKPRTIFWCSMTDLFGEWVPDSFIDRIFATMALTPQHKHLVLTKRPERMREYMAADDWGYDSPYPRVDEAANDLSGESGVGVVTQWPLPNVALGTSVSNQDDADRNIPHLLNTPAALRFVSYEPATSAVDFSGQWQPEGIFIDWLRGTDGTDPRIPGLDAIIIGGESGPNARPFDIEWARSTIRQCDAARRAVAMVKQLGANVQGRWLPEPLPDLRDGPGAWKLKNSHGADPSKWPEDLRPYAASVDRWPWA